MLIRVPNDVREYVKSHFTTCNQQLAADLSAFPGIHEESLDMRFISYFAGIQGPVTFPSEWIVRVDAHFIGGGRHFGTWEVADIGLMIVFRRRGKVIRSKMVFLQSKRLYAKSLKYREDRSRFRRFGLGRLIVSEDEHNEIIQTRILSFDESSRYRALRKGSDQQDAMYSFQSRFGMKMYYLFYNPLSLPHSISMPLEEYPEMGDNEIGCRVAPKDSLDSALESKDDGYSPSYADIKYLLDGEFLEDANTAGWTLEHFVGDLMLDCREGLVDDSPNFKHMVELMNQKSSPMSTALSITFDMPD